MMGKLKDVARVIDKLVLQGGVSSVGKGRLQQKDGSPVPPETIMRAYGVSREEAEALSLRGHR